MAPDLHATDLAGWFAEGAIHGPGLIAPAQVLERARAHAARYDVTDGAAGLNGGRR